MWSKSNIRLRNRRNCGAGNVVECSFRGRRYSRVKQTGRVGRPSAPAILLERWSTPFFTTARISPRCGKLRPALCTGWTEIPVECLSSPRTIVRWRALRLNSNPGSPKAVCGAVWAGPFRSTGPLKRWWEEIRGTEKDVRAAASGRPAITHYETLQKFSGYRSCASASKPPYAPDPCSPCAHRPPDRGDAQYGRARKTDRMVLAGRQMLHAEHLTFTHPRTGLSLQFQAPIPDDMRNLLTWLRTAGTTGPVFRSCLYPYPILVLPMEGHA